MVPDKLYRYSTGSAVVCIGSRAYNGHNFAAAIHQETRMKGYPPGTRFQSLPDDYVCPDCSVRYKEDFDKM